MKIEVIEAFLFDGDYMVFMVPLPAGWEFEGVTVRNQVLVHDAKGNPLSVEPSDEVIRVTMRRAVPREA